MTFQMYLVADDLPGRLWIMPCPQGGTLEASMREFKARGVDTIVSLLPAPEMAELGVLREPKLCAEHGLGFLSHPIVDFGLPEETSFALLITDIAALVRAGHGVAVHCRAGIGRSGMTTAGTLIALGFHSQDAVAQVTAARGVAIPDTVEQGTFIAGLPELLKSGVAQGSVKYR
jgi:protein-tyrosine phosphatase